MDTSVYPQFVALTGIPLRQTINESDKHFYTAALASPASHAAIVLAFDGDDIDHAVKAHPAGLRSCDASAPRASPPPRFTSPIHEPRKTTRSDSIGQGMAMSTTNAQSVQSLDFHGLQPVLNGPIGRLLFACVLKSILDTMDKAGKRLANPDRDVMGDLQRVTFTLISTKKQHARLRSELLAEPAIDALLNFRDPEED